MTAEAAEAQRTTSPHIAGRAPRHWPSPPIACTLLPHCFAHVYGGRSSPPRGPHHESHMHVAGALRLGSHATPPALLFFMRLAVMTRPPAATHPMTHGCVRDKKLAQASSCTLSTGAMFPSQRGKPIPKHCRRHGNLLFQAMNVLLEQRDRTKCTVGLCR